VSTNTDKDKKGRSLQLPLSEAQARGLKLGEVLRLSGVIYTARDAAHKRMIAGLEAGEPPPFPLDGALIYYVGPTPPKPGQVIGSAGPTTSGRMDAWAPTLIARGLRGMIGKGPRGVAVIEACRAHGAVYLAATGGAGALLARSITAAEVVAYEDLGTEAIRRLEVTDFPVVVVNDCRGGDLYQSGREQFSKSPVPPAASGSSTDRGGSVK
jgi:fumarate hydratase subunit beta